MRSLVEARRLCEVAEIEVSTLIDLRSTRPEDRVAAVVHRGLERSVLGGDRQRSLAKGRSAGGTLEIVRQPLIAEINRRSALLLRSALAAFRRAMAQAVAYEFSEGDLTGAQETFCLDPSDLPFIRFHDDALAAAIELRSFDESVQLRSQQMAIALVARRQAQYRLGDEDETSTVARVHAAEERLSRWKKGLPERAAALGTHFVSAMEVGSSDPSCIPVCAGIRMSSQECMELARVYSSFGSELRYSIHGRAVGEPASCLAATIAWMRYRSYGQAFRIIGAWLRSFSAEDIHPTCALCYRHVTALRRCSEHATKTYETRAGRLGKRIRPDYLQRVKKLVTQELISESLTSLLRPAISRRAAWVEGMEALDVPAALETAVLSLAQQLRTLWPMFGAGRGQDVEKLFVEIVRVAVSANRSPEGRSVEEMRLKARKVDDVRALLSLKGFMCAWYAKASHWLPFGQDVPRYGFDPAHPCISGVIDPHALPRDLLRQRAWEEALDEFVRSRMPDASDIQPLLAASLSATEIAQRFNTSHQTIRNNLKLPRTERRRNRL